MHDCKGRPISIGDTVLVPFDVANVFETEGGGYCNVQLETVAAMYPGNSKTSLTLNTKQTIRANEGDDTTFKRVVGDTPNDPTRIE